MEAPKKVVKEAKAKIAARKVPETAPKPELVEFNYDTEDDGASATVAAMQPGQVAPIALQEFDYAENETVTPYFQEVAPTPMPAAGLFLITGQVRLDRRGQQPVTAEQTRLVYANNFQEAVAKYSSYFAGLSNQAERYTVVGAGGSEAIR